MYRQSFQEQNMPPGVREGMSQPLGNDYYRGGHQFYKPQGPMEMQPMHQMYYEGQPQQQQQPPNYIGMMGQSGQMGQNPQMAQMGQSDPNYQYPMQMDPQYDPSRYYWRQNKTKGPLQSQAPPAQSYFPYPSPSYPYFLPQRQQVTLVQRISALIKLQLPMLQAVMVRVSGGYTIPVVSAEGSARRGKSKSRSRSRQKDRHRGSETSQDWLCRKCTFSNYEWRDQCKRCNEPRPNKSGSGFFVPGPEDWKCSKCANINYARRLECNRCKKAKNAD